MNNKGFTLIELLAVIIILSLLAVLANTSVTKVVKDSKVDLYNIQLENIKLAAESWGSENLYKLPSDGKCKILTVGNLKKYGLLDSKLKDPRTNSDMDDNLKIKISSKISDYGTNIINYEVNSNNIDECEYVYPSICSPVSESILGNVPTGEFEPGDEYKCKVKETMEPNYENGYTFYVLSVNENKVNLIMDRNILDNGTFSTDMAKGTTEWLSKSNYITYNLDGTECATDSCTDEGPYTALNYLKQATSTWTNLEKIQEEYKDSEGNFETININAYARLPKYSELTNLNCSETENSCKKWLVDNLNSSAYVTNSINGIHGYWIMDTVKDSKTAAWALYYNNNLTKGVNIYDNTAIGVRPVISLSKANIY